MNKIISGTNPKIYIIVFIILTTIIFTVSNIDKKHRINSHLKNSIQTFSTQYKTVYNSYMDISQAIHTIIFDSPKIIKILEDTNSKNKKTIDNARDELHSYLKDRYNKLTTLGLKQLHFHTKDNKSFLRMHQPEKYGDDLSQIRYSVRYVNENHKYIHGLEAGRIVHGFRFVYPIFNDTKYLGSVEFSISSDAFVKSMQKTFDTNIHFIAKKDVIYSKLFVNLKDSYITSIENEDYLMLKDTQTASDTNYFLPKKTIRRTIGKDIERNFKKQEPFSEYILYKGDIIVTTFLPLRNIEENKVVAYLVSYTKNNDIRDIISDYVKINILVIMFTALLLFFIYLLNKNKQKLLEEQKIISENSKLDSMRDMIGNIAHNWRQPLSTISTTASSLQVQHELNILKDSYLDSALNSIIDTTKDLSETIDGFKNFITKESKQSEFYIHDILKDIQVIIQPSLEEKHIKFIQKAKFDKQITTVKSILLQSILKILNNSIDALEKIEDIKDRAIILTTNQFENKLQINIQDTGGGIPISIINNIFEPYFTTKHQATGTGLGLYFAQSNVVNVLKGKIAAENIEFEYNSTNYKGALFKIVIPI